MTTCIKVTQVKLDVRRIIENLKKLENLEINEANLNEFIYGTDKLLDNLESIPLEYLKIGLKKRQKKRCIKRLKKQKFQEQKKALDVKADSEEATSSPKCLETSKLTITKAKSCHQLRSLQESQRFLKNFELLEQLHLARGQNTRETRKFSEKLQQLKSIWNCLLQEQLDQTSKNLKIQQQWNKVLFGPPEKMYFQEKPNLQNLIIKRRIWDSYIDNNHGSSIPTGWILPPLEAEQTWCPYLASSAEV